MRTSKSVRPVTAPEIMAIGDWKDNAELIAEGVAPMGYLDGFVLDLTYGDGGFWTRWLPDLPLVTNDLDVTKAGAAFHLDFCDMAGWKSRSFDAVVLDPPYKLSGTPRSPEMDARFGTGEYRSRSLIENLHVAGTTEAIRLSRRHVLVKTMSQVNGGKTRWLTDIVTDTARELGARKVTQYMLVGYRPQPKLNPDGSPRRQLTPRNNYSTLLVFEVPR